MKTRLLLLMAASLAAGAFAAPIPKTMKKSGDEIQIVGEWLEPPEKARIWWFKADGTAGGGDLKEPKRKGLYKLDSTASPKTIDWSDDGGETWELGVYSLEGDELKVNIARDSNKPRPTSLEETPQSYFVKAKRKAEEPAKAK